MLQTTSSSPLLRGAAQTAPPHQLGIDTDTVLTQATLQQLRQLGYRFCARYLSLTTPQCSRDLSREEAALILGEGLALIPVQHVLLPGWAPTRELGNQHGQAARQNALQLGVPQGVNVWCDLEGVRPGTRPEAVVDYCYAWYTEVAQGGYVPGLYVGYDEVLSSTQLYENLPFEHYWSSFMAAPVAFRGTQLIQLNPTTRIAGVSVDVDVTQQDERTDSLVWWAPGPQLPHENEASGA